MSAQVIQGHRDCECKSWSQVPICRLTTECHRSGRTPHRGGFSADIEAGKLQVPFNFCSYRFELVNLTSHFS